MVSARPQFEAAYQLQSWAGLAQWECRELAPLRRVFDSLDHNSASGASPFCNCYFRRIVIVLDEIFVLLVKSLQIKQVAFIEVKCGPAQCVSCHMPKIKVNSPGGLLTFTDHQIRIAKSGEPYPN